MYLCHQWRASCVRKQCELASPQSNQKGWWTLLSPSHSQTLTNSGTSKGSTSVHALSRSLLIVSHVQAPWYSPSLNCGSVASVISNWFWRTPEIICISRRSVIHDTRGVWHCQWCPDGWPHFLQVLDNNWYTCVVHTSSECSMHRHRNIEEFRNR